MECPGCQQDNPPQAKFCLECGTRFSAAIPPGQRAQQHADLQHDLTEARKQQSATAEILRVISSSPTDVQAVFDTIVANAVRLCHGNFGAVHRYDGEFLHLVAHHNIAGEALEYLRRLSPRTPGKAVRERRVVLIADFETEPDVPEAVRIGARLRGSRSNVTVPMLRGDNCLGVIVVGKRDPGLFPDEQVQLLQTFADQAVIAIENVRLFTELQEKNRALTAAHAQVSEALGQQTATAEILKVISSSPTDLQPTMDAVAENAALVCGASDASIFRVEGDELRRVARFGSLPMNMPAAGPLSRTFPAARSIIDRQTIHVDDFAAVIDNEFPGVAAVRTAAGGIRTLLATPLMREGVPIGAILIRRTEVRPFTTEQVALLETFADQAVIAIENVRLFSELQARTADLTRSVDRLTALSEVGRAVSSTLDLDTVLQTIVSRAVQLTGTDGGSIYEYDAAAEEFEIRATRTAAEEIVEAQRFIRLRKGEGVVGQLANTKQAVQVPDITAEGAYSSRMRGTLIRAGVHSLLAVPLLRDDELIGALVVTRGQAGTFAVETIELLRTFATQSALAIQNARLFHEIEDKSRQLETASQHKSEFLANMSHELRTPLNAIIGFSEVLGERLFGELNEKQDEYLKDIHASGQHLLSLINDILDLSKIEAGRMELELTDFDLPTAIDNALTLVRERAGRRGISLHQAADEGLGQIQGDERKIKQVLLNLLSNAIKFTPEAGRIEVRAKAVDRSVEVSVSDTGVGIAPEDQEAIFEEFRQVGTADKKVEGTGLGLALSRKFIELHGGRIWVQSQVGVGSTFSFTIPMRTGP